MVISTNSNLPSTISDSKINEKEIHKINPKTDVNRKYIKHDIKKENQIKKLNIETDNNIKYLKNNLQKIKTENNKIEKEEDIINKHQIKSPKVITKINLNSKIENKNCKNNQKNAIKINTYKKEKERVNKYINNSQYSRKNMSSFDKRKTYIVPKVKSKKKKNIKIIKTENEDEKKIKDKKIKEIKELLTSKLIENKQIEYLKDYQKYIDEFNNKIYKNNEKKFRFIQEEGIELDELLQDNDDDKMNDTIDEIYEKEENEIGEEEEELKNLN